MDRSIAIVGISAELPSGTHATTNLDHEAFYEFLINGFQSYERIPSDRFNIDAWKGTNPGQICSELASFIKDIDQFDNVEFGISSRDARGMAPGTRKLLENCFLALLDSGIDYRARRVGCYTSSTAFDIMSVTDADLYEARGSFSGAPSMVANRISTHLDLLGPSLPTDTACSSSLTAFHLAVQAILNDECEAAVVGGCQINHRFADWFTYSQAGIMAKDGRCKPFDASADGFGRAEGCVAVVLKPTAAALRDHDKIYATVLGTSINSCGGYAPPGAPVAEAQRDAMIDAFRRAGRNPQEVDYVELHATGTAKGDPVEANWVGEQFKRDDDLLVGSVKGNIGHTEIVAFLASLSKVLSSIQGGVIPPNVNVKTLNPAIHWDEYKLKIPLAPTPLPCRKERPLIAMSSSGIGGSNGHVVLEGPPKTEESYKENELPAALLMASGLSSRTTSVFIDSLATLGEKDREELAILSTILGRRSKQMTYRSFAVVEQGQEKAPQFSAPQHCPRVPGPIVFVFSGQGPQHKEMGRQLFKRFPVFRRSVLEMDEVFKRLTNKSIVHDHGLFGDEVQVERKDVWPISLILPSIAVFQMAMYDLLVSLGIKPDIVIGHSAGETAVLYASGAASKAMAVELSIIRGTTFVPVEAYGGGMAALGCGPEDAAPLVEQARAEFPNATLEIACYNSPTAVAIAGHDTAISKVLELAKQKDIFARQIRTRVPIHSSMMDYCQKDYCTGLKDLFERYPGDHHPKVTTYSTYTGLLFEDEYSADYFWNNTRNAVRFTQAIDAIAKAHPATTFLEISPHPVLSSYITSMAEDSNVFDSARRAKGDVSSEMRDLLSLCGKLTAVGHNCVDFTVLNGRACHEAQPSLPPYPFVKKSFPIWPDTLGAHLQTEAHPGPLNRRQLRVNKETHTVLGEHIIRGEPIMPAAGFIEMALEFGATMLVDVSMRSILPLSSDTPTKVEVDLNGSHWTVKSFAQSKKYRADSDVNMGKLHAEGYLLFEEPPSYEPMDITEIRKRCPSFVGSSFYQTLAYFSNYGPRLRRVACAYYNYKEALVSIRGMDDTLASDGGYVIHPAIMDACLHITAFKPFHGNFDPNTYYLPASAEAVIVHRALEKGKFPPHIYAHVVLNKWTPGKCSLIYEITLLDDSGRRLCTLHNFEAAKHRIDASMEELLPYDVVLQPAFNQAKTIDTSADSVQESEVPYVSGLREALLATAPGTSRRLVRLLLFNADRSAYAHVEEALEDFSSFYFEVFIQSADDQKLPSFEPQSGVVHVSSKPVDDDAATETFDIILAFEAEGESALATKLSNSLIQGGLLVLSQSADRHSETPELSLLNKYSDGTSFAAVSQKASSVTELLPLIDEELAFVFTYHKDNEGDLKWDLSGLDTSAELDIWIFTQDGPDGGAALGLVRALRREYLVWTIHLVIFPQSGEEEERVKLINQLPPDLKTELDIIITSAGEALIPRVIPLHYAKISTEDQSQRQEIPAGHILIDVVSTHTSGSTTCYLGTVVISDQPAMKEGMSIVGFTQGELCGRVTVDTLSAYPVSLHQGQDTSFIPAIVSGMVSAVLAIGVQSFKVPSRLRSPRIVVTHSDTVVGWSICKAYSALGLEVVPVTSDSALFEIASLGPNQVDLVISGYDDASTVQILQTLLRPIRGKTFLWNHPDTGLSDILRTDPWAIQDAIQATVQMLEMFADDVITQELRPPSQPMAEPIAASGRLSKSLQIQASFDPDKTYLILGGIGSIGAYISHMLYQRGARHIVVTSRRGESSLASNTNLVVRRMFEYLKEIDGLDLRLEAVDASSHTSMEKLFGSIGPLGGCFILTAVLTDRTFLHLDDNDFTDVYAAKPGVLKTLDETYDLKGLDFIISFSSIIGVVGNAGQTTYGAANTALEEATAKIPNAFSFVCPGIIDSSLVLAGKDEAAAGHMNQFATWGMSASDMIAWLEDAISRFQRGQHFRRYLPKLDWDALERTLGMPTIGRHLLSQTSIDRVSSESTEEKMAEIIRGVLNVPLADFSPDTPLTAYGIDSLSAARLSFLLRPIAEFTQLQLLADVSMNDLQRKIAAASSETVTVQETIVTRSVDQEMKTMLAKYTAGLKGGVAVNKTHSATGADDVVLATGTTGGLGCNILVKLLQSNEIKKVYAFNRKHSGGASLKERQRAAFLSHGFSGSLVDSQKLVLIESDLSSDDLGVSSEVSEQLSLEVTHIIHNAWKLDFYAQLEAFEELIAGTRRLINFASSSKRSSAPTFSFISTVAIWRRPKTYPAPEAPIVDSKMAVEHGYSESKWVAERVTQIAAEQSAVTTNVIRAGLLTGSPSGYWDTNHWLPALVQSAEYLGCLPEGDENISWLPIDTAAAAIVDMRCVENDTVHLVHPTPVAWATIMEPLAEMMHVPLAPFAEWLARLERTADIEADNQGSAKHGNDKAAVKLLMFFREIHKRHAQSSSKESMGFLPQVAVEKGVRASRTLSDGIPSLGAQDVAKWLAYWRGVGFLSSA
ncbi:hypothetical protein WOLCODRAFT_94052 [Wolfiporia cocos MD-104 SS10]|uniref:Polyketide synthase n=1 Tax=Wolfiporia cocos (strain MD-104) TaxID=742152 RepID=A0A2H3J1Q4_WOLCO|nr:hypothetical protein WOLCODRAFT_94052 [Wolfiporia cocos MD-104 SS10]